MSRYSYHYTINSQILVLDGKKDLFYALFNLPFTCKTEECADPSATLNEVMERQCSHQSSHCHNHTYSLNNGLHKMPPI